MISTTQRLGMDITRVTPHFLHYLMGNGNKVPCGTFTIRYVCIRHTHTHTPQKMEEVEC